MKGFLHHSRELFSKKFTKIEKNLVNSIDYMPGSMYN